MTVYQVEEYYLSIVFDGAVSKKAREGIESLLSDEGFSNYEFQDNDSVLVIDDIPSEHEGEALESQIIELLDF